MKHFLIIGGSNGIGKALVHQLTEDHNNSVKASYFTSPPSKDKMNLSFFYLDVNNLDKSSLPDFDQLDGLVYLPGTLNLKPFRRLDIDLIQQDFKTNVLGAVEILQHYQTNLKGASVVLVSSIAAQIGYNYHTSIAASKGAIEAMTRSLAAEWAGVTRVNCVAPSLTQTALTSKILSSEEKIKYYDEKNPSRRIGQAKDVAHVIEFLLSEKSHYINGSIIPVDGGDGNIK